MHFVNTTDSGWFKTYFKQNVEIAENYVKKRVVSLFSTSSYINSYMNKGIFCCK